MISRFSFFDASHSSSFEGAWWTGPYLLLGIGGYACYLAWFVTLICNPVISAQETLDPASFAYMRVAFFLALALSLLIGWACADRLSTLKGNVFLAVLAVLFGPAASIGFIFPTLPLPVQFIFWVASGIGAASLVLLWSVFLSMHGHRKTVFCTAFAYILAGLIFIVVSYMQFIPAIVLTSLLAPLSAALFLSIVIYVREKTPRVSAKESDRESSISWKSFSAATGNCMCLGFAFSCTATIPFWPFGPILVGFIALATSAAIAVDGCGKERFTERIQLKMFLPCATVGILPMAFVGPVGRFICVLFLFVAFIPQALTNINAISENVHIFKLNPIRVFGLGRTANVVGVVSGFLLGYIAFNSGSQGQMTSIIVVLGLIFIFILIATFILENHYPIDEEEESENLPAVKGFVKEEGKDEGDTPAGKGLWKLRCEIFARQCDLSPRQTEVLFLLAKGRNASYIQERLVVSNHTAKAHIYNIYQKTNVHSRQELISHIESVDIEGKISPR